MIEKYFDASYIWSSFPQLLPFLGVTFLVAGLSVLFGTAAGLLLAAAKLGQSGTARRLADGYTTIMRCTPSIVLLFLVYYGVPFLAGQFGLNLHDVHTAVFVVITFTLQFAAILSEVARSAILAINRGQYEAAVSVGLSPLQAYRRIVLPQAAVVALPNFANGLIALLQEGALAYTIGLIDIVGKANLIVAANFNAHALEVFIALALLYWVLSILIGQFFGFLEKRLGKGRRTVKAA
ncbi:amino acid ABC transporter permease [Bhargavaea ullalensis]|uniref:L-cystine transport system permease protein n=1 Tax=Bhargavaea ullalensis TaxID=1265685 RepID=A0ABV2GDN7_9BACL